MTRQQLGGVETVFLGAEHLRQTGRQLVAAVDVDINLRGHRLVTLGLDDDHAIGTLGAIEGGTVLQHLYTLDIVDIEVGQQVVIITVVEHRAAILHVHQHVVDDHQGLCVGIERVDTLDEHCVAQSGRTAAVDHTHIGTQLLCYQRVDADFGIIVEPRSLSTAEGRCHALVCLAEGIAVESGVDLVAADGTLLEVVAFHAQQQ